MGPVIQIARVVGLPEALVLFNRNDKRPVRPVICFLSVIRVVRLTCHDVVRELSALQAFFLDQRTSPGPPEDLRPWLFELLTRWVARI